MITTKLNDNQIQNLTKEGNITFMESFEQFMQVLDEKVTKFWFEYHTEGKVYPFELSVKITRNWLDDNDATPVVELDFSTIMAKHGEFLCLGNDILDNEQRKKDIQNFYFKFENILLTFLNEQNVRFSFKREDDYELFEGFQWFQENKGVSSSGRNEEVKNLEFESGLWKTEEEYKNQTLLTGNKNARKFIRYFLNHHHCDLIVKDFLMYVVNSDKEVQIVNEVSHWNYNFVIRPDMLTYDSVTLSKLGFNVTYNFDNHEDRLAAMIFVFEHFSKFGIVNLCMDTESVREFNAKRKENEDPFTALMNLQREIENLTNNKDNKNEYQKFEEKYSNFLDGLLDLYNKYNGLYEFLKDEKYKKRAERLKNLWNKYNR